MFKAQNKLSYFFIVKNPSIFTLITHSDYLKCTLHWSNAWHKHNFLKSLSSPFITCMLYVLHYYWEIHNGSVVHKWALMFYNRFFFNVHTYVIQLVFPFLSCTKYSSLFVVFSFAISNNLTTKQDNCLTMPHWLVYIYVSLFCIKVK